MKTATLYPHRLEWRHDFHTHPELGFKAQRTLERIAELRCETGYKYPFRGGQALDCSRSTVILVVATLKFTDRDRDTKQKKEVR